MLMPNKLTNPRFRIVFALLALSLSGVSSLLLAENSLAEEIIQAKLSKSQTQTEPQGQIDDRRTAELTPQDLTDSSVLGRIRNNLELPTAGNEVKLSNAPELVSLKQAIGIAFRNNRQVQSARLVIERSQAGVTAASAPQKIQVGTTANISNQGTPLFVGVSSPTSNSTNIQGGLQATYNILDAGRNNSSVQAAEEQVNLDKLDLLRIEQKLRGDVIAAYYDLQEANSTFTINQATVTDATRSLRDAKLQEQAGVGTKFDILRAEVQLANAIQARTTSMGQQKTARRKISQLLSVSDTTEYAAGSVNVDIGGLETWSVSIEDSIILAFKNRPEIKQQLVRRKISEQQQNIANTSNSAQVNLFANYDIGKSISASTPAQDNYSLGVRLSWNFWDGGGGNARSYQEKINQEIFENEFTTSRNQVRFEVEQAYNSLATNRENIGTSIIALQQASKSSELAELRFKAGVGTQTDVIQAQTELARARGNRTSAFLNYNRALSSLKTATLFGQ